MIVLILDNQRCTHLGFHLDCDRSAGRNLMRIRRGSGRRGSARARSEPESECHNRAEHLKTPANSFRLVLQTVWRRSTQRCGNAAAGVKSSFRLESRFQAPTESPGMFRDGLCILKEL
jgi:hypothetical protein